MSFQIEANQSVSPSAMNSYFNCGAKWRYDKLFERKQIQGIFVEALEARLGTNFHSSIIPDYFGHISDRPTAEEIERVARQSFKDNFDQSLYRLQRQAQEILENFIKFEKLRSKTWPVYKPELLEEHLESPDFNGIVDFYCDGTVIDWKTGSLESVTKEIMRQGTTYKHLLESTGKVVKRVLFVVLSIGRVIELPQITLGWLQEERRKYLDSIKTGIFYKNKGPLCKFCPWILRCWSEPRTLWDDII